MLRQKQSLLRFLFLKYICSDHQHKLNRQFHQQLRIHRFQYHQQHRAYLDKDTVRAQGRGLPEVLPRALSYGRGADVLDPPQRGLSFQPHRRALLP